MSLCGCYPACSCQLTVGTPELLSLIGNGDPATGGWTLSASETVFAASSSDDAIDIVPGGPYGHAPLFSLRIDDTDSVDLNIGPAGLTADVRIDPASPIPLSINAQGLSVSGIPPSVSPIPTGTILDYFGIGSPSVDYLLCNGEYVLQETYPALFAVIQHTASGGIDPLDGTFKLPDFRGRASVGPDDMGSGPAGVLTSSNALGNTSGSETHVLTEAQLADHSHTISHTHTVNIPAFESGNNNFTASFYRGNVDEVTVANQTHRHTIDPPLTTTSAASTSNSGTSLTASFPVVNGAPHNNLQPYLVVNKIIKT